jgi:hypothetical protein
MVTLFGVPEILDIDWAIAGRGKRKAEINRRKAWKRILIGLHSCGLAI